MTATGIPQLTSVLLKLEELKSCTSRDDCADDLFAPRPRVTMQTYKEDIISSVVSSVASLLAQSPARNVEVNTSLVQDTRTPPSWARVLDGNPNLKVEFPRDFEFPTNISLFALFNLWNFGNADLELAPYRRVDTRTLQSRSSRSNYSKAQNMMYRLEDCCPDLKEAGVFNEDRLRMRLLFDVALERLRSTMVVRPHHVDASYTTYYSYFNKK